MPPGPVLHDRSVDLRETQCVLPESLAGVPLAREFVRTTLSEHGADVLVEDALLVVSELVTNAVLHGYGAPVLRLGPGTGWVRIEVADDSPCLPARRASGATGGWGLALVERLASNWGATRVGRGKVVWCELPAVPARLIG